MKKYIAINVSMFFLLLSFLIRPDILWAAEASSQTKPSPATAGLIGLVILFVCVIKRNNAIGGWLLYYFIQLYFGAVITAILIFANSSNLNPSSWGDFKLYALYILFTVPSYLLILAQIFLSFKLTSKKREWKYVKILMVVLLIDLLFSIISIPVDLIYWPNSIYITLYSMIWPLIWLPYFKYSKRVKHVFKDNDWDMSYLREIAKV